MEMEEQLAPSTPAPAPAPIPTPNFSSSFTPEMVEQMKARAREEAIRVTMEQRQQLLNTRPPVPAAFQAQAPVQPQVVYVRRNLTLAELLLTLLLACGIVTGVQFTWKAATSFLPRIQIQIK